MTSMQITDNATVMPMNGATTLDGAALTSGVCALPDAPMAMPVQIIEHEVSPLQRLFSGLRSGVPAQGN
ncbi:hypothetical protein [Albirhodobacter sp. R86504]|uniref:hypothetical protein n=1 Tax=Albirhodobacter sp. R86504 TaxID=3093848 RepID=UPI00366BFB29